MRVLRHAAVCAVLFAAASGHAADEDSEVARLRASAESSLAAGKKDDAKRDLVTALSVRPSSIDVLSDLIAAAGDDADEREVWALRLAATAPFAKGRFEGIALGSPAAKAVGAHGLAIAKARAEALADVLAVTDKLSGPADAETVRLVARIAEEIAGPNPQLRAQAEPRIAAALARTQPPTETVVARLRSEIAKARSAGKSDLAFLGARALRGLGAQRRRAAGGVALDPLESEAIVLIDAVRQERWAKATPLTVEDLRAIPPGERRAWELAHSTWDAPALVVSPKGHYRIESVQGPRTTLMVALDIDGVHDRLAKWIGRDPFEGRPGTLRLVRDVIDMEAEGQTLVWARGFNAGEVTTMPGGPTVRRWMSRGYSHEQTHRFDGELYGWLPGWLREGRANWAQVTDTWVGATELDARAVAFDMLGRARFAGYGDAAKLASLLDGRPATPQDDYDTGYSLWLYLSRHRSAWYVPKIDAILTGQRARGMTGAKELFVASMCDGKDGRPASLADLAADYQRFLDEAAAMPPVGWAKEWQDASRLAAQEADKKRAASSPNAKELEFAGDEDIFDLSNHAPVRTRSAAPAYGATHAFAAATFLETTGATEAARAAYAWARCVDEPTRESLVRAASFHEGTGNAVAAWLLRSEAARMGGDPPGRVPQAIDALAVRLGPLARRFEAEVKALRAASLTRAADEIVRESARLAAAMGVEHEEVAPGAGPAELLVPLGLRSAAWTPAQAQPGAATWCVRGPYDLIVGRGAPGSRDEPTAAKDVASAPVFVECAAPFDGGYTLRARVRPLSTATPPSAWSPSIGVVLGKTGDDRGLTVHLIAAPFEPLGHGGRGFDAVTVRLDDQRASDWGAAKLQADVKLASRVASFDLALTVRGAYVAVEIDGRAVLSFRTATGLPLDGRAGFLVPRWTSPVEFQDLRVERHADPPAAVFDLARDVTAPPETWDGLAVRGVPRDPLGTLLLLRAAASEETPGSTLAHAVVHLGTARDSVRLRAALPAAADGAPSAERATWSALLPGGAHEHHGLTGAHGRPGTLWLAIDGEGIVRSHGTWEARDPALVLARTLFRRLRGY